MMLQTREHWIHGEIYLPLIYTINSYPKIIIGSRYGSKKGGCNGKFEIL